MFERLVQLWHATILVCVVLHVTSGQYVALQVIAWTQMVVDYSQKASLVQGLVETFDGQHPCEMCKSIEKAKQTEKKSEAPPSELKREYFCESGGGNVVTPPHHVGFFPAAPNSILNSFSDSPLVPPPRDLLV